MIKLIMIISACFLLVSNGICGTFLDSFDGGKLNMDKWTIIADSNGTATIENSNFKIVGGGDWNITGIRFNQTVDISKEKLAIELDALPAAAEFLIAFSTSPTKGDPWDAQSYWAWLVMDKMWQWESNAQGAKASIKPSFQFPIDQTEWHHFKVEISPTGDESIYDTSTSVDDGKVGEAKASLDIAGSDPSTTYIHVCAGYNAFTEPTLVGEAAISANSIEGNISIEYQGQLPTTWGELKSR
jgi:hypothetical protein